MDPPHPRSTCTGQLELPQRTRQARCGPLGYVTYTFWCALLSRCVGFGFDNSGHTPDLVRAVTAYFRSVTPGGVYIIAGVPTHWRTAGHDADADPEFLDVWLNEFDALLPWTVGRYRTETEVEDYAENIMVDDVELLTKRNDVGKWRKVDYIPVVLPGASVSHNCQTSQYLLTFLPRAITCQKAGGASTISEETEVISCGSRSITRAVKV